MNFINIQPIPNQKFSVTLESSAYDFVIEETNGCMSCDITRDGVPVVQGQRMVAGTFLLPYLYEEQGNFLVLNLNETLIYYTEFQATQFLAYLSAADLQVFRS